eukprot:scaffold114734_cov33-Tisochrysis_lutea.AAC.3
MTYKCRYKCAGKDPSSRVIGLRRPTGDGGMGTATKESFRAELAATSGIGLGGAGVALSCTPQAGCRGAR